AFRRTSQGSSQARNPGLRDAIPSGLGAAPFPILVALGGEPALGLLPSCPAGSAVVARIDELTLVEQRRLIAQLMNESSNSLTSRRELIKNTGRLAAASALAGVAIPHVHAAGGNTIQVALVGCGGRGGGAAGNALSTKGGPISLVAMADVFEHRLKS